MTILRTRPAPSPAPVLKDPVRALTLFLAVLAAYLTVGTILVFGFDSIMEDALSRLSAASSVWSSDDPKLAALGFVWTPLPALLMVPFTPLRVLWPALVSSGYLAVILSAIAMAGSVSVLYGILADLRIRAGVRWTTTALFALQPLILVYASNGMTEALLMTFLLLACRRLLRWVDTWSSIGGPDGTQLVSAGTFLGLGYLARYEALAVAVAATALVTGLTAVRTARRDRGAAVLVDVMLIGLPTLAAFVLWAVISFAVVGSPFAQFTSAYGNSAQVASRSQASGVAMLDVGRQLLWLVPLAAVVVVAGLVHARLTRDVRALVPLTVFGSVLAFEWLLRASGNLFGFLRYQIMLVPLVAVLLGVLLADARRGSRLLGQRLIGPAVVVVVLGSSLLTSGVLVFTQAGLASQEYLRVHPVVSAVLGRVVTEPDANGMWTDDRAIAAHLDAMRLPPGTVLADTGAAFAIVAASHNPRQFVITADDAFPGALVDPQGHGIRFILRNEHGGIDTVRATWPVLGTPDAPWSSPAGTWPGSRSGSYAWTLWSVAPATPK